MNCIELVSGQDMNSIILIETHNLHIRPCSIMVGSTQGAQIFYKDYFVSIIFFINFFLLFTNLNTFK